MRSSRDGGWRYEAPGPGSSPASGQRDARPGIGIASVVEVDGTAVVTGWIAGGGLAVFANGAGHEIAPDIVLYDSAADDRDRDGTGEEEPSTFMAIWRAAPADLRVYGRRSAQAGDVGPAGRLPAARTGRADVRRLATEHVAQNAVLLRHLAGSRTWVDAIARTLPTAPPGLCPARGHLDAARAVPAIGGIVVGWFVSERPLDFGLLSLDGTFLGLAGAARWNRPDAVEAVAGELDGYAADAGFLQGWHRPVRIGDPLYLVALDGDRAYGVGRIAWTAAQPDPVAFARWSFDHPTPIERFGRRLSEHDGPVIEALVARRIENRPRTEPESRTYGPPPAEPGCTVVVPLHGRHDFLLNQLLEFGLDDTLRCRAEIIYVVDDPALVEPVFTDAPLLYESYKVPFRVVWSGAGRGFAGATNLGVSLGRAPHVLLLNSDVVPLEPGWLDAMREALARDRSVGIVGARLLYASGALQHDGMAFRWDSGWGAYLNKHPGAGLEPKRVEGPDLVACPAVTAACLLMTRELFDRVGGLDERFLVGDFEDSDLCLKVRATGLEVACLRSISLIHLERQSMAALGSEPFRDKVARYNAWRHQARWGDVIAALSGQAASEERP